MSGAWASFVALGDSFTEGLEDRRPDGTVAGWADRVADVLAERTPGFRYANLAVRGVGLDRVVAEQVPAAVAMRPELVGIAAGGNDVLRPRFDLAHRGAQMDQAVSALSATGATVLVFAGFDPGPRLPFGRTLGTRAAAYNDLVRASARRHDAVLVDMWAMDELADPRMWSVDRLHLSALGHRYVCGAVLTALGQEVPFAWPTALEPLPRPSGASARRADLAWSREYLLPWIGRRIRGRSSGDGLLAKRRELVSWPTRSAALPETSHPSMPR